MIEHTIFDIELSFVMAIASRMASVRAIASFLGDSIAVLATSFKTRAKNFKKKRLMFAMFLAIAFPFPF
ncbi:hypothetical protein [Dendronalium sp. ChiSLP03b]|uniref:hypothetical protein n=1 Tax=Dendronalium sp. ChiSLP03b TaxID=3075381 RepID=UPI002AD2EE5B|nr:hypothetical protein [Dendronalium sp. ChiSLP03b]MDZ8203229.1 hypothetical protein [Dendronalium sp. ChiSLP03b]